MTAKKPWAGRFNQQTDKTVEQFTASIGFDHILYKYDIMGSIAHCRMLEKQRIITPSDAKKIIAGLQKIEKEIERGRSHFCPEHEDIHMYIENELIKKIGPAGGKLHTARSRNDQIALDISLYLRDAIAEIDVRIENLQLALIQKAEENIDVFMPGFTHLQHAQPVLLAHHLMAYFEMLQRDRQRLHSCFDRVNVMPLGAAALAGTPYPVDRAFVAELLGYPAITANSIDTVSDRDAVIEFCSISSLAMMHLSRFCEELILWSSSEFHFIEIPDSFCTGSSIMPQKKNPDVCELIRAKSGRVYGHLLALLSVMKSLPLAYNRDLQEDKEALFDTVETLKNCLHTLALMVPGIKVCKNEMAQAAQQGFPTATDLADYLAAKGIPFRNAHEIVGKIVAKCIKEKKALHELTLRELQGFSCLFQDDAIASISIENAINRRTVPGGTAKQTVIKTIKRAKAALKKRKRLEVKTKGCGSFS